MREDLELKITVSGGSNIGEKVRALYNDGTQGDGICICLTSDGFAIDVVKLERADGLPLAIEEDFSDWFSKSDIQSAHRYLVYKAYLAGRAKK